MRTKAMLSLRFAVKDGCVFGILLRSAPGTWQQRSDGGLGTPRAAAGAAAAAAASAAARGISHPGAAGC